MSLAPIVSAQSAPSIYMSYGFGNDSYQGRITPWPWNAAYYLAQFYAPTTFQFQYIPIMGNIAGTDTITFDCGNGTVVTTYGSTIYANVWGWLTYLDWNNSVSCTYTSPGTYSPTIHVVRNGTSGSGYTSMGWFASWNFAGESAEADYSVGAIQIQAINYAVSAWPNNVSTLVSRSPLNNVRFTVGVSQWQCSYNGCYDNPVGGAFSFKLDCYGDGSDIINTSGYSGGNAEVSNVNYNDQYIETGGTGYSVQDAFSVGSCNYPNQGIFRPVITATNNGSSDAGGAVVVVMPSSGPAIQMSTSPSGGSSPLNSVTVDTTSTGIFPAPGSWGPVNVALSCQDNNQTDSSYNINFNTAGTPMSSTLVHNFVDACNYPTAGDYTARVAVTQNGISATATTEIDVAGALKCDGTDVLKAPANFRLDWQDQNSLYCTAGGNDLATSLPNWLAGVLAPSETKVGNRVFSNVTTKGYYLFQITCYSLTPSFQPNQQSCPLTID